jgi:hypothetical protein
MENKMSSKSLLKFVAAFGILAILLAFLGVNYVPRIFASSSAKDDLAVVANLSEPVYLNQRYQRSIAPQLSYTGSDYFERQALALAKVRGSAAGSDYFERHPFAVIQPLSSGGSDFLNHHPFDVTQKSTSGYSAFLNHHPFDVTQKLNFGSSEFLNHHPFDASKQSNSAGSDSIDSHPFPYYSISDWTQK